MVPCPRRLFRASFNPLGRGVGIGGGWSGSYGGEKWGFNPLGRGVGIGGGVLRYQQMQIIVSIRLDAA